MPTAPAEAPHSRDDLVARLNVVIADMTALGAQRDAKQAEVASLLKRLMRHPDIEAPLPVPSGPRWLRMKDIVRKYGKSADTFRRHGVPAGWCWLQGGRWVCDPQGVEAFLSSPRARPRT